MKSSGTRQVAADYRSKTRRIVIELIGRAQRAVTLPESSRLPHEVVLPAHEAHRLRQQPPQQAPHCAG
jgi:hypothetical protein